MQVGGVNNRQESTPQKAACGEACHHSSFLSNGERRRDPPFGERKGRPAAAALVTSFPFGHASSIGRVSPTVSSAPGNGGGDRQTDIGRPLPPKRNNNVFLRQFGVPPLPPPDQTSAESPTERNPLSPSELGTPNFPGLVKIFGT